MSTIHDDLELLRSRILHHPDARGMRLLVSVIIRLLNNLPDEQARAIISDSLRDQDKAA